MREKLSPIPLPKLADTLAVLGNRRRLEALKLLSAATLTAGQLAQSLGIGASACSQITKQLLAYDMVTVESRGQLNYYSARPGPVVDAVLALAGVA